MNETAHAALRGVVASMAMTGTRVLTISLGLVSEAPPQQIAGQSTGPKRALVEAAHWGFGAVGAIGFRVLPSAVREKAWTGPLYGMGMWAGFEAAAPLLGLPHAEAVKPVERLALLADHALYGFVLDEMRRGAQG